MKKVFFGAFLFITTLSFGQNITNFVLVGPDGVTEDPEKATSFIVIKQYPDNHFERLDYKKGGPMVSLRSYKDSSLEILEGNYYKYAPNGSLKETGKYLNNQKTDKWYTFNDTGKVITTTKYDNGTIVIEEESSSKDSINIYPSKENEASFPGGLKAWQKYLLKSLENSNTADKAFSSGTVYVNFKIDTIGNVQDIFISKSVEYIIDQESIEIIKKSPKWNPALINGKSINAFRRQPISFVKQ